MFAHFFRKSSNLPEFYIQEFQNFRKCIFNALDLGIFIYLLQLKIFYQGQMSKKPKINVINVYKISFITREHLCKVFKLQKEEKKTYIGYFNKNKGVTPYLLEFEDKRRSKNKGRKMYNSLSFQTLKVHINRLTKIIN